MRYTWYTKAFIEKFTMTELQAIWNAASTNEVVCRFIMMGLAANEIESDDVDLEGAMDYFVSLGILTQARRDEILNTY